MSKCTEDYLVYEFEPDGSTRAVCYGGKNGDARTMCPHFGGKCPAIGNNMRTMQTYEIYTKRTYYPPEGVIMS